MFGLAIKADIKLCNFSILHLQLKNKTVLEGNVKIRLLCNKTNSRPYFKSCKF